MSNSSRRLLITCSTWLFGVLVLTVAIAKAGATATPQSDVLFVPKSPYSDQPQLLCGAPVAEGYYTVAWPDLKEPFTEHEDSA